MAWRALQKRVGGLFSSRRQQSPSSSPSGQPCATTTGASELQEKVQGRLHRAAARGDLAWLRRWRWYYRRVGIDPPDQQRRTPLHLASANGHADVVRYLVGKNCKLNVADNLKRTPLMRAVQCQQEKCVVVLLEHDADPNLADADGNTALHLAVLSGNTTAAGLLLEHNASIDAQNKDRYTPLNLAVSKQHEEMLECLLKKAADGHAAEQCERTALAVSASHEADVEEDKLRLQEELEKVEVELQEMEETYLNSERCVQNLIASVDEKDRQELVVAQDQVSAYFDNQTTVKQLEEHVLRLEIHNTRLEATVHQQNSTIEALQRDLQASASLQEVKEKYLNSECCVQNLMAALEEKERETTASAMKLQDQVLEYLETVKQLEEHVQRLGFEKTCLEATVQRQSNRTEALQRDLQATTLAQAASQDRLEQIRASHHGSLRKQLKGRIGDHQCKLDKTKNSPQDNTFPKECTQAEVEKYKELYLEEVKTRRCLAKELERRVQQEQEEKITKELERATAEVETGFAQHSKKFHLPQDPVCRAKEKYHDVLTKNYKC